MSYLKVLLVALGFLVFVAATSGPPPAEYQQCTNSLQSIGGC